MITFKSIGKFVLLSVLAHLLFLRVSGLIAILPEKTEPPPPVNVSLIEPEEKSDPLLTGRIEDLPTPLTEEKPDLDTPAILSRGDSRAHNPEEGDQHRSTKTAIPRERIDPVAPTLKKSKKEKVKVAKKKSDTKVASLDRPILDMKKKNATEKIDLFSTEALEKAIKSERVNRAEKGEKVKERESTKPSVTITDQPDAIKKKREQSTGADLHGSDIAAIPSSETGDVIDMGDEAVVSLNTRHFAYVDYFTHIKKAVELVWVYPEEAVISGMSGRATIRFTLAKSGALEGVELIKSSGHKALDDEAMLAVKAAAPYKPFPVDMKKKRLHIVGAFVYLPSYGAIR